MTEIISPIPSRLNNVAVGGHVAGADQIIDDQLNKDQETINSELIAAVGTGGSVDSRIEAAVNVEKTRAEGAENALDGRVDTLEEAVGTGGSVDSRISSAVATETTRAQGAESNLSSGKADKATTLAGYGITDAYTKSETYTKTEVNGLVDTPHQEYVTVDAYANLPASGSKDTIYRVSNYNGSTSQVDTSVYSEYAWDGNQYVFLCVKSQIGEVFDISVYNNNAKYADLAAALNGGANIPQSLQKGGMSVKFVCSSDNKYIQARCMAQNFTTDVTQWQGMDDIPTAGSNNLVNSGGVYSGEQVVLQEIDKNTVLIGGSKTRDAFEGDLEFSDGKIYTQPKRAWFVIPLYGILTMSIKSGYQMVYGVNDNGLGSSFTYASGSWTSSTVNLSSLTSKYLGVRVRRSDEANINASELADMLTFTYSSLIQKIDQENERQYQLIDKNNEQLSSLVGIKWVDEKWVSISQQAIIDSVGDSRFISDFIPCPENTEIKYIGETNHASVAGISFWDIDRNYISGFANNAPLNSFATVTSPTGTAYCIISGKGSEGNTKDVCTISTGLAGLANTLEKLHNGLFGKIENFSNTNLFYKVGSFNLSNRSISGNEYTIGSNGYMFYNLNMEHLIKGFVTVEFTLVSGDISDSYCRIWNKNAGTGDTRFYFKSKGTRCFVKIPSSAFSSPSSWLQFRIDTRNVSGSIVIKDILIYTGNSYSLFDNCTDAYVSPQGDDSIANGSDVFPFASINTALKKGAKNIYLKGGVYFERLALEEVIYDDIRIESVEPTKRVKIYSPDSLISESESAVSGYTKVYSCNCTKTIHQWIFQDGVDDETTLITDAERNPYQRGYAYRCEDTKITECSSENLSDALDEIESANEYKWYLDGTTLYFSRPQVVNGNNPLRCSSGNFISGASREKHLTLRGIEVKYMKFNLNNLSGCLIEDCKASNVYGDAFTYDACMSVKFIRCEAARAFSGQTGDGFNAHSSSTGDKYSKQTTCMLIDCWSHDNNDDGYSDHERSEIEIHGGLFEYNGKAGVTPSFGSHCSCYGVISRKNNNGFYCVGEATQEEGGKYGQMLCMNCVSENNGVQSSGYGFGVANTGNKAILVSCKSIGNKIGYYSDSNTEIEMIDCGTYNDNTQKSGGGTFVIKNTSIVN